MVWVIVLVVAAVIVFWVIATYNKLVAERKKVENSWSQIDVQLKRRSDLIPNLVNAVKGYMKFESDTLEKVMNARARALGATNQKERMDAEGEVSGVLGRLLAVVENYPELKANQNVMSMQEELSNTENKISYSRQFYNDITMKYNTAIEQFPANLIAKLFNFKMFDFFKIPESEKEVPKVDLNF
ncbi:MAG TPA: LemA family protein [Thermotogota bacterium]|jgi:LemA protein|nr:LemA family protein [Thermotogota bacterium]NLZ13854.1 LemA family protein [Thermotogaceae bacterium]MDD8040484.1 LemA family protein [Thermotogota bacterium]MDD8052999.1 LemA family protein [Thermotogota bacterium]HNR63411.1 LemA family protein [Thermotogota bacterium]